jgi:transcriptional regulator with XRE-family HTH domain
MNAREVSPAAFGDLLRMVRLRLGFTHDGLAEHARMSSSAVAAIEQRLRGAPYRHTIALLSEASGDSHCAEAYTLDG